VLAISRQTDYACRILLHLALNGTSGRLTAREVAAQRLIPPAVMRRIVTQLSVAGLVKTTRGSVGGIALARPPHEISLLDVVQAMEGPITLNACTIDPETCPFIPVCAVHEAWCGARARLLHDLGQLTFDRLAARQTLTGPPDV
jgi:Rrf2 family protein